MDPNNTPTATVVATIDEDQSSKTTTEETTDQTSNEMGSGRSYECVFCKRGFTTAQALGGHMNIHRKDRVKTKPNTPSKPEPFNNHPSTLRPTMTTTATTAISHHQSFQTYFPTSSTWCLGTTTTTPSHDHQFPYVHNNNNPQVLNTFKDQNWTTTNMSLASQSSPILASTDRQDKRSYGNTGDDDDDDDEELDLELRLGHDR